MGDIFIIIPTYNEGQTIVSLIHEIDLVLKRINERCTVVIIDDCSTDNTLEQLSVVQSTEFLKLKILTLQYNLGHQGAIAQGILFANENKASHAIIMDGDGEDDPTAIPQLLDLRDHDIVHVLRGRRRERFSFRLAYGIYRVLFKMITNRKMNFGNYCLISSKVISILSVRTFIHFAAFLSKLQFKSVSISVDRRERINGKSKMGLTSLIHHAFRSFAEYGESLLMVFLRLFVVLFIFFVITICYIVYLKIFTVYPIIGWSSTFGIGLLTSALICMGFFVSGVLLLNLSQYRMNIPPASLFKVVR